MDNTRRTEHATTATKQKIGHPILYNIRKEFLEREYIDKQKTLEGIAREIGCSQATIFNRMRKYGIPTRDRCELFGKLGAEVAKERKLPIKRELLAKEYIEKNKSQEDIAKEFKCSPMTIHRRLKEYNILIRDRSEQRRLDWRKRNIYPNLEPSSTLSYIFGVLVGDGTVTRKQPYQVLLKVNDFPFAESFSKALRDIGLHSLLRQYGGRWYGYASSKIFCDWYHSLSFEDITKIAEQYPIDFVRGFYESEGCVSIDKRKKLWALDMTQKNQEQLNLVKKLIESIGVHVGKTLLRQDGVGRFNIYRQTDVYKFLNLIRPCIKTKPRCMGG